MTIAYYVPHLRIYERILYNYVLKKWCAHVERRTEEPWSAENRGMGQSAVERNIVEKNMHIKPNIKSIILDESSWEHRPMVGKVARHALFVIHMHTVQTRARSF